MGKLFYPPSSSRHTATGARICETRLLDQVNANPYDAG